MKERTAIWNIVIKKYGRDPLDYDTERFTGAKIEQAFIDALRHWAKGRARHASHRDAPANGKRKLDL